ncbi:hypothetical protein ACFZA1_39350 [Streptomyces filipinensis]|uniref:hypothetical protein n=1 Tax=Streptomyces filipinensis TaxID=66887 RepID=UPI0036E59623
MASNDPCGLASAGSSTFSSDGTDVHGSSQPPIPSVNATPHAYGDDDPLANADPSGDSACQASGS